MYSGITNIYYRKTQGHVFTKPVQIEGTKKIFPSKLFFIVVHISAAKAMRVYVVKKNGRYRGEVALCVGISHE
jgi:hypothetical protein